MGYEKTIPLANVLTKESKTLEESFTRHHSKRPSIATVNEPADTRRRETNESESEHLPKNGRSDEGTGIKELSSRKAVANRKDVSVSVTQLYADPLDAIDLQNSQRSVISEKPTAAAGTSPAHQKTTIYSTPSFSAERNNNQQDIYLTPQLNASLVFSSSSSDKTKLSSASTSKNDDLMNKNSEKRRNGLDTLNTSSPRRDDSPHQGDQPNRNANSSPTPTTLENTTTEVNMNTPWNVNLIQSKSRTHHDRIPEATPWQGDQSQNLYSIQLRTPKTLENTAAEVNTNTPWNMSLRKVPSLDTDDSGNASPAETSFWSGVHLKKVSDSSIVADGAGVDTRLPLKVDANSIKMLQDGLSMGGVKNVLTRDGLSTSMINVDHNIPGPIPLMDDPQYAKYFTMLKLGLPMGAVKNAMTRDGLEPTVMDGDHNAPVPTPLKDDPQYTKYFTMLQKGLTMEAAKNAMTRDGLDPSVIDNLMDDPLLYEKYSKIPSPMCSRQNHPKSPTKQVHGGGLNMTSTNDGGESVRWSIGDTIDLLKLPVDLFPMQSRTKNIPLANDTSTCVLMGSEVMVIAQKRNDCDSGNIANVLWCKNYTEIRSLNLLDTSESGIVRAEISINEGRSYPLCFDSLPTWIDLIQIFYQFKNNFPAKVDDNHVETEDEHKQSGAVEEIILYSGEELKLITQYRKMRKSVPKEAIELRLENKGVSDSVRDAIFEPEKKLFKIPNHIHPLAGGGIAAAAAAMKWNNNQDLADNTSNDEIRPIHPLAGGGIAAAAAAAAMKRNNNQDLADNTGNDEIRPIHPLAGGGISAAAAAAAMERNNNQDANNGASNDAARPIHPLAGGGIAAAAAAAAMKRITDNGASNDAARPIYPSTVGEITVAPIINQGVTNGASNNTRLPLKDDPKYAKYFKMLKMGIIMGAVKNAITKDGLNPSVMDGDHNAPAPMPLKDDPKYAKYFKMLKMGLPMGAVKNAITKDGLNPSMMDGDHNAPAPMPLKDDPKYAKYFKMLKMGLPVGAVKNAITKDGLDPSVMDGDHNLPASTCRNAPSDTKKSNQDKFNRVKVYWDGAVKGDVSDSIWGGGSPGVEVIFDDPEFEMRVQKERRKKIDAPTVIEAITPHKGKKKVEIIDGSKNLQCEVLLRHLKDIAPEKIAIAVDEVNPDAFSSERVGSLKAFLPTEDEQSKLKKHLAQGELTDLNQCERIMVQMMNVEHCKEKLEGLSFIHGYSQHLTELQKNLKVIDKACDELKESKQFRSILTLVLGFGNKINTAAGMRKSVTIPMSSLVKLKETKDIDSEMTLLELLVHIIMKKKQDITLLSFQEEIPSVRQATKVEWGTMVENAYKSISESVGKLREFQKLIAVQDFLVQEGLHDQGCFLSDLKTSMECTKARFDKLTSEYFRDDVKVPHQWFMDIDAFTKDFQKARVAVTKKFEAAEKKATVVTKSRPGTPASIKQGFKANFTTAITTPKPPTLLELIARDTPASIKQGYKANFTTETATPKPPTLLELIARGTPASIKQGYKANFTTETATPTPSTPFEVKIRKINTIPSMSVSLENHPIHTDKRAIRSSTSLGSGILPDWEVAIARDEH